MLGRDRTRPDPCFAIAILNDDPPKMQMHFKGKNNFKGLLIAILNDDSKKMQMRFEERHIYIYICSLGRTPLMASTPMMRRHGPCDLITKYHHTLQ